MLIGWGVGVRVGVTVGVWLGVGVLVGVAVKVGLGVLVRGIGVLVLNVCSACGESSLVLGLEQAEMKSMSRRNEK